MNKENILKILESAKDKNGNVPMRLVRQAFEKLPIECEDDKHCSNCIYSGRPTYKSPCSECRDNSQWEVEPISRSHENSTECEDAVSRADVEIEIANLLKGVFVEYEDIAKKVAARLPSVTPKPKTGKWVNNIHDLPVCDQCGYMTPYDRAIDDYEYGNYCPNCGAKMEGANSE